MYTVVCEKGSENSLVPASMFDRDAIMEFEDFDADGNEVYTVESEHDLDRILDTSDGVLTYHK